MDKWFRNNNVVKVTALLIGILLWFMVRFDTETASNAKSLVIPEQRISNVSVVPTKIADNLYVQAIEPAEVTLILRGKESMLRKMDTSTFHVELDMSKARAGTHSYPLKAVDIPGSVTYELMPETARVTIEEKQKKEVPVIITVTGTPAEGNKAGQPVIKPGRVHVTLPTSMLDSVESTRAEISVDKATSMVTKQIKLTAYGKDGKPIALAIISPPLVDVEVPVTMPFKAMPLQVKLINLLPKGFSVASMTQSVQKVTVYGTQNILDNMEFYSGPQIDLTGLTAEKTVTLDIALNNKVVQVEPNKVEIKLTIVPTSTKLVENIPLKIVGANDNFVTKLAPPESNTISSVVEGAASLLDTLRLQDVQAIVDVSNLAPGRHVIFVSLNLPAYLNVSVQQPSLKVLVDIIAKETTATAKPN